MHSNILRASTVNPYQSSQVTYGIEASGTSELAGVRRGIAAVYTSVIVSVLVAVVFLAIRFTQMRLPIEVLYALQAVQIGAGVLAVIGRLMCVSAPAAANGTGLIIFAAAFEALGMSITIGRLVTPIPYQVVIGSGVLSLIGFFLFLAFLKQIAAYIRQPSLVADVRSMIAMSVTMGVFAIGWIAFNMIGRPSGVAVLVGSIAILVLAIWTLIVYARLLSRMKEALRVAN